MINKNEDVALFILKKFGDISQKIKRYVNGFTK